MIIKIKRITILPLFLILLGVLLNGCANKPQTKSTPSVYDGSIGAVLGCVFAPNTCKDIKNKDDQDQNQIIKEVDKAKAQESK